MARSFKSGKRYALRVENGNQGRSSIAVCLACMRQLSGKLIEYGIRYDILLAHDMLTGAQWWEAPESAISTLISVHVLRLDLVWFGLVEE